MGKWSGGTAIVTGGPLEGTVGSTLEGEILTWTSTNIKMRYASYDTRDG